LTGGVRSYHPHPEMTAASEEVPTLQSLFRVAEHRQNLCVLTLLTWVASCDGATADDELKLLRTVAAGVAGGREVLPAAVEVGRLARPGDLELACRYLRNHATRADRSLLAQLFISMAARDGRLTVAENHVLRFLADLLGISARKFARLFESVTHRPFPEVGDVSSVEWWKRREAGEQAQAPADNWGYKPSAAPGATAGERASPPPATPEAGEMTRAAALQMFGLDQGASADAIHAAHRRLAKARHPDRYARLGPAAQAAAAAAFQRVQEAYAVLS
jgi:DnaJ like chaperone protein